MKYALVKLVSCILFFTTMACKPKQDRGSNNLKSPMETDVRRDRGKERPTVDELFLMMDKNKDEKLSKTEVKGPLLDDFSDIDTDGDGFLSKVEVEDGAKDRGPKK